MTVRPFILYASCIGLATLTACAIGNTQGLNDRESASSGEIEARPPQAPPLAPPAIWETEDLRNGLRHLASGYTCPSKFEDFMIGWNEAFPSLGHGNDVVCLYRNPQGDTVKLHLTNFGRDVSLSAHLKGVETNISQTFEISGAADVPVSESIAGIANMSAFEIDSPSDAPTHTAVWIEQIGKWHVKVRATYEANRSDQIGVFVSRLYLGARSSIAQKETSSPP